jgi:hypothetical protein
MVSRVLLARATARARARRPQVRPRPAPATHTDPRAARPHPGAREEARCPTTFR